MITNRSAHAIGLFVVLLFTIGCWGSVSPKRIPGTYVASYPFGTETLILNADGSFTQRLEVKGEPPLTASGTWTFDSKESYVRLKDFVSVVDGFGRLKSDWRTSKPGLAALPADIRLKITLDSGAEHPYIKQ